jgi:hypothetical protein
MFLLNLLNVLVQIANKMGLQKNAYSGSKPDMAKLWFMSHMPLVLNNSTAVGK